MKIINRKFTKRIDYTVKHKGIEYLVTREDKGLDIIWTVIDVDGEVMKEESELWDKLTDYCWQN